MLEWREKEHKDNDHYALNDMGTVNSLRQCGLLKFFKIWGMRAQLRLLEYLVHMWDVGQQVFYVGAHVLSLDIEDISISWLGLSCHGSHVTLTYLRRYYVPGAERRKGKVAIRDFRDLPL
jgi:hypothetical protein